MNRLPLHAYRMRRSIFFKGGGGCWKNILFCLFYVQYLYLYVCIANFFFFSFFTDDESDIPKRRNSQTYLVDYLKEKPEMEMATKRTELELRKEELRLQKAQFDLDREERLQRMEIEKTGENCIHGFVEETNKQ